MKSEASAPVALFTTCPTYDGSDSATYLRRVCEVARWSDQAGCKGILVYTDNSVVDPWLISQKIIQETRALSPLVAVHRILIPWRKW